MYPSDATALPGEAGKEECWLVLDAEPDACLAIGFERSFVIEEIRTAALDGTIAQVLRWHPARAGDLFHLPAGTVRAIGAGLTLVDSPHFRLDRITGQPGDAALTDFSAALLALPLAGEIAVKAGSVRTGPGECFYAASTDDLDFSDAEITLLACTAT